MAICTEGQMQACSLGLETPLACSGASTCLFLPRNCHFCQQTQEKASLGFLQPPLHSQAGLSIKRMTCPVGFSSKEWDLKEIQTFWMANKPSSELTSLQAMHPAPTRIHRYKPQQTLKPLEGRSSCLNFMPHVVLNWSKSTTRKIPAKAMHYHSSATSTLHSSSRFIAISTLHRLDHLSWITVNTSERLMGGSMERHQLLSGLGLTVLPGGFCERCLWNEESPVCKLGIRKVP